MKKYDVTALGELLVDFTENKEKSVQGNLLFEANPGGAPCNVLAMLAKLGHKTAFIGKVGNDFLGNFLRKTITEAGIDAFLHTDSKVHTTLAMVHTYPDGDRDFFFYRNPGADIMLEEKEIQEKVIEDSRIFHFGTLSMTHERVRRTTKKAVQIAEKSGALISFDPNLRLSLWDDMEVARKQVQYGLEHCHILKISDNEIQWFTGKSDYTDGVRWLLDRYQIPLILVTMGKYGSRAYYKEMIVEQLPFIQKNTIETTGAGDTFFGCVLHYICKYGLENLQKEDLQEMLMFANAAASIITTRKGALKVMPDLAEIKKIIYSKVRG